MTTSVVALRREPGAWVIATLVGLAMGLLVARTPLVALASIAAIVGIVIIVTRAELALLVMIAALPWENKLDFPSETFSAVKGIGALVMLAYVLRLLGNRRTQLRLSPMHAIVACFGTWILLSLTLSPEPLEGTEKTARWILLLAFFFLVTQLITDRRQIRSALRWFTGSAAAAAAYGLWLFVVQHYTRVSGPLLDANDFGYQLACALPINAYLISADRGRRPIWMGCFVLIALATLGTLSRGALVGIGALIVWGMCTRRIPLWVLASGLATTLAVLALALTVWSPLIDLAIHEKTHIAQRNTESREVFWSAALKLTERRPLTGVGPGRYPHEAQPLVQNNSPIALKEPETHNTYLEILAENGAPALLLFVAYLIAAWLALRRVQQRAKRNGDLDERRLATALQGALVIAMVSAIFLSAELTSPFWLFGALAMVLLHSGSLEHGPQPNTVTSMGIAKQRSSLPAASV
jgi:putative inorganic carbon (hco3(-)) transporter